MKLLCISALAVMTMAALAADKENKTRFSPGAASSYPTKQSNDGVTVAASAYDTEALAHNAFGKLNPYQHGVLPVLVIIQNDTDKAMRLDGLQAEYIGLDRERIEATPPADVQYVGAAPKRPQPNMGSPIPPGVFKKKNPLNEWEIVGRAFAARMLPPHESVYGFFYFQARHRPGAKLYLTGITEASTGKGLLYYEIPLEVN